MKKIKFVILTFILAFSFRQEVAARDTGYKSIVEDVAGLEADPRAVTGARLQNTGAGMLLGNRFGGEEEER